MNRKSQFRIVSLILLLSGCSGLPMPSSQTPVPSASEKSVKARHGVGKASMLENVHTAFFDICVQDAYLCASYDTIKAPAQHTLLAIQVVLNNTTDMDAPMFDTDFQIQWGTDDFAVPVTYSSRKQAEHLLEDSYTLSAHSKVEGVLLYAVPQGITDFQMFYQEYDARETLGDLFVISIKARQAVE